MEFEFYTNEDIQFLTGKDFEEVEMLINDLNCEIKAECDKYHLEPLIYEEKVLKDYFIRRMEINL